MTALPLIIVGAGGHGCVVADALLASGERVLGFTDADLGCHARVVCGLPVLGDDAVLQRHAPQALNLANGIGGVGDPQRDALRREAQRRLAAEGWHFVTIRHPAAVVSPFARIGNSAQILAAAVVQAGASVGEGCIINTAAVVEHDVSIGNWTHVAPRALICGDVVIGSRCHIGAGAVVRQGLRIPDDTIIGAGAVVIMDCPGAGIWVGVPARALER